MTFGLLKPTAAFDIATNTGYAVGMPGTGLVESGAWCLGEKSQNKIARASNLDRRMDQRFTVFCDRLRALFLRYPLIERVTFEDVEFASSQAQGQLFATLRSALWCAAPALEYHCIAPSSLKKFFAGHGRAEKSDMAAALEKTPWYEGKFRYISGMVYHPVEHREVGDDEVDALALLHFTASVDSGAAQWPYSPTHEKKVSAKAHRTRSSLL